MVGVAIVAAVGAFAYWQVEGTRSRINDMQMPGGEIGGAITMEQVADHTDGTSCWSAINGSVYDLTSWIPQHPGGSQAILQLCGTDGSEKFNGQHGGSPMQERILAGFKIGELSQ